MTKKNPDATTGRPKQYDEGMLRSVISDMLADGTPLDQIDAKNVKPRLCEKHGVSETINSGSLGNHVDAVLRSVVEEQEEALLATLPGEVGPAIDDVIGRMKKEIRLMVARQNKICQKSAERECEALRKDKANANWRIGDLEGECTRLKEKIAELQTAQENRETELVAAHEQIAALQSKLAQRGPEARTLDLLIAELRDPAVRHDIRSLLSEIVSEPDTQRNIT